MFYPFCHRALKSVTNQRPSVYVLKVLTKILASTYDFAVNFVMVINIAINKTLNIYDSVKKFVYAASTQDFAVCYGDKYYY